MAYSFKISKRGQVLLFIILGGFMAAIAAFSVWYVNQDDTQVAPEDSAAGICCDSGCCNDGWCYGYDSSYGGSSCGERRSSACESHGGSASGGGSCSTNENPDDCGSIGDNCCEGNGCDSGLDCNGGVCEPNGGSCNGTASCGNSGCSCDHDGSCDPKYDTFKCVGEESSCNSANEDPEAQNMDRCITIQYDVRSCNGTSANVVRIDADGKVCSSNDGNLSDCDNWDCDPPIGGNLDRADCDRIAGWACDGSDYNQALEVHIYDGSTFVMSVTANQERSDLGTANVCGGTTAHGFSVPMPQSLLDGGTHNIKAYAIALDSGAGNPELGASPKSVDTSTCFSPPDCTALSSSLTSFQNGDTTTLSTIVDDADNDINKVEFSWSSVDSGGDYCTAEQWTSIGNGVDLGGGTWSLDWTVSGIPDEGAIVIAAGVTDGQSFRCSGNPSAPCSAGKIACTDCSLTIGIDTPICNSLSITGGSVQNGETLDIGLSVTDPNDNIGAIPVYWALYETEENEDGEIVSEIDYCGEGAWTLIGSAANTGGSDWALSWDVTGIPNGEGEIVISADPTSSGGTTFCTGNPGGDCGTGVLSCPTCNEDIPINIPLCGGSCTDSEQCDGSMECVGGMCRNPLCTEAEDCECDIPVTGLFDSARNKMGAGLLLVILSFGFVASDRVFGFTPKVVFRLSDEGRHENAKDKFEDSWDSDE